MPTLIDGREVASTSPEWRLETLARHVLSIKPLAARRAWLEDFEKKHGPAVELRHAMEQLHARKVTKPVTVTKNVTEDTTRTVTSTQKRR